MTDGDEDAVDRMLGDFFGLDVAQQSLPDLERVFVADDVVQHGVPQHRDLRIAIQPRLQNLLGAEMIAAMNHGDLRGEVGQEQRLLDGSVAAADHDDLAVA